MSVMCEYTCEACGETFVSDRTDEDAEAEFQHLFGNIPKEERAIICEDCFIKYMKQGGHIQ